MAGNLRDLLKQAGFNESERTEPEVAPAEGEPESIAFADKVVVRHTRKGRGGRTVTLVSGVETGREPLMATLRKELGVGARLEGDDIVLHGHQVERVARWLESRGAKKVVRS